MPKKGPVLIVDDDSDLRETLAIILDAEGYPVTTAADGLEAQRSILGGNLPALVLLDMMMPTMNGEQLLQWLAAAGHADVPVCVMSGHHVSRTTVAGAAAVLSKPVDLDVLLATIARLEESAAHAHP